MMAALLADAAYRSAVIWNGTCVSASIGRILNRDRSTFGEHLQGGCLHVRTESMGN